MAEAVVMDSPAIVALKYFCHQCNDEIGSVLPGFKCPNCNSGFIEEVQGSATSSSDDSSDDDVSSPMTGSSNLFLMDFPRMPQTSRRVNRSRIPHTSRSTGRDSINHLEIVLQDFFQNLTSNMDLDPEFQGDRGSMIFYGNARDYVFGRGELDAIITELMNNRESHGTPPLSKDDIAQIPTIRIDQTHIDKGSECTVCWENYVLAERVRKLSCSHLFHNDCIVPWLKLNGTCPVCRGTVSSSGEPSTSGTPAEQREEPQPPAADRPSTSSSSWLRGAGRSASGFLSSIMGSVSSALNGRSSPPLSSSSGSNVREGPSREPETRATSAGTSGHPYNLRRRTYRSRARPGFLGRVANESDSD